MDYSSDKVTACKGVGRTNREVVEFKGRLPDTYGKQEMEDLIRQRTSTRTS